MAEVCITSAFTVSESDPSVGYYDQASPQPSETDVYLKTFGKIGGFSARIEIHRAQGKKCARSWKISDAVGSDPNYPDVTARDAQALREWDALKRAAE